MTFLYKRCLARKRGGLLNLSFNLFSAMIPQVSSHKASESAECQIHGCAYAGALQAGYYASKVYVASMSNAIWRKLQGSGVALSARMPGAMRTGFSNAGGFDSQCA